MRKINTCELFTPRAAARSRFRSGNKRQSFAKDRSYGQVDPLLARLMAQAANHHVDAVQVRIAVVGKQAGMEVQLAAHLVAIAH